MRKLLLLTVFVLFIQNIQSQEIYFQTGKNYTQYDYKSDNDSNPNLQAGSGNFYEIGYQINLSNENFKYLVGLSLDEYNAIGGNQVSSYSWNTQYLGVQNTFSLAFVKKSGFEGDPKTRF
jgi:hypothetical protein